MAPGLGIDFLDKDFKTHLDIPRDVFYNYEDVSAIGLLMKLFSPKGTSTWVNITPCTWNIVIVQSLSSFTDGIGQ
jgi:hypothetical protein